MHEKKRLLVLIEIMVVTCIVVTGISIWILYHTAINAEKERLREIAQSQARLIEAVARFDEKYSNDYPDGSHSATISQIIDAHNNYAGFGETGEFTLAKREGDYIIFLLSHRHYDLANPKPINFKSKLVEPMRLALSGKSGTMIGLDYRGEKVIAAHEPVAVLGLGIVAKIDISELRSPFIKAGFISFCLMAGFVTCGTLLFIKISNPIIRKLQKNTDELKRVNLELIGEIDKQEKTEKTLKQNESFIRAVMDNLPVGVAVNNFKPTMNLLYMNRNFPKIYRFNKDDLIYPDAFWELVYEDPVYRKKIKEKVLDDIATGDAERMYWNRIPITRKGQETRYISARSTPVPEKDLMISMVWDVTEQYRSESEREITLSILKALHKKNDIHDLLNNIAVLIQNWSACEVVGICLKDSDDYSYFESKGFPPIFREIKENLCLFNYNGGIFTDDKSNLSLECLCWEVLTGSGATESSLYTDYGSVWANSSTELFSLYTKDCPKTKTQSKCIISGYESVALIPLKAGTKLIGLLLVNYPLIGKFNKNKIEILERLASSLAIGLSQRLTEIALKESEKKYRSLIENAHEAIFITQDEKIKFPNYRTEELTGYTLNDLSEMHFANFIHPDDKLMIIDRYHKRLKGDNPPNTYNYRIIKKTGETVWVQTNLVNITWENNPAILVFIRDISKLRKLEHQLQQSQKMESVGRLAGGVAHDYNNISTIVLGYAELALEEIKEGSSLHENIIEIIEAAKRSADITKQLLAFARQQTISPKVLDLNYAVENMIKMLRRLIGEDIDLAWKPSNKLGYVKIDPTQIDQILVNLCVNSRDAIKGVGKITIETRNVIFDEEYCADHAGFKIGGYIMLAVSDNGVGITYEQQDKIFEPFFTTKEIGHGTGLGLSTVYGIVKQNNGFINVYSEPDKGTTIKIYLPKNIEEFYEEYPDIPISYTKCRGETILIVEDDNSIMKLTERILKDNGYVILSAQNSNEAIRLANEHTSKIDLLLTDVVMPEINGSELAKELQRKYEGLKVLFMSGYTANVIVHQGVLDEGVNFIAKPFSREDLTTKIREIFDKN